MTIEPRELTAEERSEIEDAVDHWYKICAGDTSSLVYSHRVGVTLLAALTHAEQRITELEEELQRMGDAAQEAERRDQERDLLRQWRGTQ